MSVYREKIILTYKYLLEVHEELLTCTIYVGMTGELADVNKVFAVLFSYSLTIINVSHLNVPVDNLFPSNH